MTQQQFYDGWQFLDIGDNETARAEFEKALAANPEDTNALIGLGKALGRLGKHNEALEAYLGVLNLDSENHEAHFGAGWAYREKGKQQEAKVHAQEAVMLAPDVAEYHLLAAKCIQSRDLETILWHLEEANRLTGGRLDRRWRLGLMYYRVFAGFAYPIQRLLIVWSMLATSYACNLSATGRKWWFIVASLPFLATSGYNLTKHRYHRAAWALALCVLWAFPAYFFIEWWVSRR
jgi:tetratricopeptide (TPR) repeat protein